MIELMLFRLEMMRLPLVLAIVPVTHFRKDVDSCGFTSDRFNFTLHYLLPSNDSVPHNNSCSLFDLILFQFFTFEQYKKFFLFGSPTPTPLTFSLAGLDAGVTEAVLVNPFEVVKVTLQSNRAHLKEIPSTWTVTKQIVTTQGIGFRGLNKGVTATILRNGVFNMVYFGFYHSVKGYLPEYEDHLQEFFRKVGIGFVSGTLASCVNIPFDVAKSRIQGPQPIAGQIKYRTTLGSMAIVYREEGWHALYKGLLPKVLRLGPGGAIMLVVYDYAYQYLTLRFPD
ncbi:mitochondrial 2-oxodicarboxylate carrier-like [Periplaneta americana]|uniref:mitochondrial 2-oxodicarboxylate carrier-like n=1 Tax=Periplaneta americana TaxID=6978 RepID=UPI0037E7E3F6